MKFFQKSEILQNLQILPNFANFSKIQLAHFVEFEKSCKMSIWLQKSALIQPRTGLGKSDVSWHDVHFQVCHVMRGSGCTDP